MSYKFTLDSFAWVEYFLGSKMGEFIDFLLKSTSCITPSIVIAELSTKFHREKLVKEWQDLFKFIKHKTYVIPLDSSIAEKSGVCKNYLREQQPLREKKVGLADAIIYQTAINQNSRLVSGDDHFATTKGIVFLKNMKSLEKIKKDILEGFYME